MVSDICAVASAAAVKVAKWWIFFAVEQQQETKIGGVHFIAYIKITHGVIARVKQAVAVAVTAVGKFAAVGDSVGVAVGFGGEAGGPFEDCGLDPVITPVKHCHGV